MKKTLKIFLAGFLFFSSLPALYGQFYQVYGYQTAEANEKVAHVEEDRIGCHSPSAFLSGYMVPDINFPAENRWKPSKAARTPAAELNYRRMPDPLADYFEIDRRPVILVAKDERWLVLK